MRFKFWTHKGLAAGCLAISVLLFLLSMLGIFSNRHTDTIAQRTGRIIESRLEKLDGFIRQTENPDGERMLQIQGLPDDMVIYRYVNDSLKSWCNQFSVINDDISARLEIQKLTSQKNRIVSPLSNVTEELSFMNTGPKWYLIKSIENPNGEKIIAGLEVQNTLMIDLNRSENGVNPNLRLSDRFTILPLLQLNR